MVAIDEDNPAAVDILFASGADFDGGGENGRSAKAKCDVAVRVGAVPKSCERLFKLIEEKHQESESDQ